jgi:hypothetical protein
MSNRHFKLPAEGWKRLRRSNYGFSPEDERDPWSDVARAHRRAMAQASRGDVREYAPRGLPTPYGRLVNACRQRSLFFVQNADKSLVTIYPFPQRLNGPVLFAGPFDVVMAWVEKQPLKNGKAA